MSFDRNDNYIKREDCYSFIRKTKLNYNCKLNAMHHIVKRTCIDNKSKNNLSWFYGY